MVTGIEINAQFDEIQTPSSSSRAKQEIERHKGDDIYKKVFISIVKEAVMGYHV